MTQMFESKLDGIYNALKNIEGFLEEMAKNGIVKHRIKLATEILLVQLKKGGVLHIYNSDNSYTLCGKGKWDNKYTDIIPSQYGAVTCQHCKRIFEKDYDNV